MPKNTKATRKVKKARQEIELHYLKRNNYRSFHVDGVFGGITPRGNIYMELFLERGPTPKKTIHQVNDDGLLGKEVSREGKTGLIREIEAGLILDLATAEIVNDWLAKKIKTLKTAISAGENK
ncbi:MAG TPA: hypothetical protein ENH34_03705 [Phycisphaerales bacterium]|nr:hypothetical protein [Phycisphaerales bacterium]